MRAVELARDTQVHERDVSRVQLQREDMPPAVRILDRALLLPGPIEQRLRVERGQRVDRGPLGGHALHDAVHGPGR
jgi:hypothetical protein